ncbi:MAG: hypothetical protein ACRDQA_25735 [Nocardioidaceae bacterium]
MPEPTRSAGEPEGGPEPPHEEKRFNIVIHAVFILLIVLMIFMAIIWQLATRGHLFY